MTYNFQNLRNKTLAVADHLYVKISKCALFDIKLLLDTAMWPCQVKECKIISEQNLLTGWLTNYRTCQPRFQFHRVVPWNKIVTNQVRKTWSTNAIKASADTLDQLMARKVAMEYSH